MSEIKNDNWKSFKDKPINSSRENPIWIASKKNQTVTLGYFDKDYGWFDMRGSGLSCSHWQFPIAPSMPN